MTVTVERLSFSYGRLAVLRDVNAIAHAGRITALLGPNASGKSTLLRCIMGALRPSSGRVLLNDAPVHSQSPRDLAAEIAYVPQRSIVSAAFSVRQVVELGRYALPASAAAVEAALDHLDVRAIENRPYPQLSVGQQQRVTLARALAQLGSLDSNAAMGTLILDEPTSAMDLQHVAMTMRVLRTFADRGGTVIMAMHDISLAAAVADDAWLLHETRCLASGSAEEVLTLERLMRVFQTNFQWVTTDSGQRRLIADAPGCLAL